MTVGLLAGAVLVGLLFGLTASVLRRPPGSLRYQSRPIELPEGYESLGVRLAESVNGWNLVQFASFGCVHCRDAETDTVPQMLESARGVGRIVIYSTDTKSSGGDWAERAMLDAAVSRPAETLRLHSAFMRGSDLSWSAVKERRPFVQGDSVVRSPEKEWKANLSEDAKTKALEYGRELGESLQLPGVPAYLLIGPDRKGWFVPDLHEWKRLTVQAKVATP